MLEFLRKLFATDFMAHVYCLRLPEVVWLHVTSDLLIACSYFIIPLAIVNLVRRRNDLAFSWMFLLFGTFILACGATHVLGIWTLWHPMYRLEGVIKALTAVASVPTAFLLFRLLPQAIALPSPAQLRGEILNRREAEGKALLLNAKLEKMVEVRTAELREINRRLMESEARFRTAAEAATDIIWTNDATGEMKGEQPQWAAFTGQTLAEYQGFGWVAKVHPQDVPGTLAAWSEAVATRHKFVCDHRIQRNDGEWRFCKASALPVLDENLKVREWVGTHTDVTEQREAEQAALRAQAAAETANRAKSAFLASMSHELRTPLNAIIGYSEMLQEELQETGYKPLVADVQKVRNSGKHLLELINDLLDLRKIELDRMDLQVETIQIDEFVRGLAETAYPLMQKNGNSLEVRIDGNLGMMYLDGTKVRQSLLNLLSNAAKFTEKGSVTFDAAAEGNDIIFRVSDTGIGIAPDRAQKLFEPFIQADPSIGRLYGGTGLGLALARRYCRLMGGDIVLSRSGQDGSTFTVRLPRGDKPLMESGANREDNGPADCQDGSEN